MKLKIGYRSYSVKWWEHLDAHAANRFGQCDLNNAQIYVDKSLPADKKTNTLIHEILHAIWHEWALRDEDAEERIIEALSNGLSQVLLENKELRNLILEGARK